MPDLQALVVQDTLSHAVNLQRVDASIRRDVLRLLQLLQRDITGEITGLDFDPGAPGSVRRRRLEALLAQTEESIRTVYRSMRDLHGAEMVELAEFSASAASQSLSRATTAVGADAVLVARNVLEELARDTLIEGAPSAEWWSRQAGDTLKRFTDQMRIGTAAGETVPDLVRRVIGRSVGRGQRVGGVMQTSAREAEALVRTSVQAVNGEARLRSYFQNSDVVAGVVQLSTLDGRTTDICIAYSGKRWRLPNFEPVGHDLPYVTGVPRHWQCRSTEAPWLKSFEELGLPLRNRARSIGTRASFSGQVPVDQTMGEFLESLPEGKVDEMLGAGRAQLWRDGEISLSDLVDQRGRPKSLRELTSELE